LTARTNLAAAPAARHFYASTSVTSTAFWYVPLDYEFTNANVWVSGYMNVMHYSNTSHSPCRIDFAFRWVSDETFGAAYYCDPDSATGGITLMATEPDATTGKRTVYLRIKHAVRY